MAVNEREGGDVNNTQEHCSQDLYEGTVISYSSVFIHAQAEREREKGLI